MSKFFVTGATGFVGSFVAELLIEQGHSVTALVRKKSNLKWIQNLPMDIVIGSLTDPDSYSAALKDVDYVLHIAGVTKAVRIADYYYGNVEATRILLETIVKINPKINKFLQVSSQAAIGPSPSEVPLSEDAPYSPVTDYGKSKAECEKLVLQYCSKIPVTIIRPPTVYGPRDTDVFHALKGISKGVNLMVGQTDQLVSVVYVQDLAQGIINAAISSNTENKIYHLCEKKSYYWSAFSSLAGNIMKKKFITLKIPFGLVWIISLFLEGLAKIQNKPTILNRQKMNEIKHSFWTIDSRQAQIDFEYHTNYPLNLGVAKTIQWYRDNNWF